MRIRADLAQRAFCDTGHEPWTASPEPGVSRKPLDRDGGELARATSLVRYAPGSTFAAHVHGGGEEFLVLEGVFSDESGDYPAGTYVRNPIGSRHAPGSRAGCTILVKLRQMTDPDEPRLVVPADVGDFEPTGEPGVRRRALFTSRRTGERVALERWDPGTRRGLLRHPRGAEFFVLEGTFEDERGRYGRGTWLRLPADSAHTPRSDTGCTLWIKQGHLARESER